VPVRQGTKGLHKCQNYNEERENKNKPGPNIGNVVNQTVNRPPMGAGVGHGKTHQRRTKKGKYNYGNFPSDRRKNEIKPRPHYNMHGEENQTNYQKKQSHRNLSFYKAD